MRDLAFIGIGVCWALAGCSDDTTKNEGTTTPTVLTSTTTEPDGTNCAYGGTHVSIGVDKNGNGALETDEVQSSFFVCNPAPTLTPDPTASVFKGSLTLVTAADLAAAQNYTGVLGDLVISPTVHMDVALPNLTFVAGSVYDCDDADVASSTITLAALQAIGYDIDLECSATTFSAPLLTQLSGGIYLYNESMTSFSVPLVTTVGANIDVEDTQLASFAVPFPQLVHGGVYFYDNEGLDDCALLDTLASFRGKGWLGEGSIVGNQTCTDVTHRCPIANVGGDTTNWRECFNENLNFFDAQTLCQSIGDGWDLAYLTSYDDENAVAGLSFSQRYWIGYTGDVEEGSDASYFWVQSPETSSFAPQIDDNRFWAPDGGQNYDDENPPCAYVQATSLTSAAAWTDGCLNTYPSPLCRYLPPQPPPPT